MYQYVQRHRTVKLSELVDGTWQVEEKETTYVLNEKGEELAEQLDRMLGPVHWYGIAPETLSVVLGIAGMLVFTVPAFYLLPVKATPFISALALAIFLLGSPRVNHRLNRRLRMSRRPRLIQFFTDNRGFWEELTLANDHRLCELYLSLPLSIYPSPVPAQQ